MFFRKKQKEPTIQKTEKQSNRIQDLKHFKLIANTYLNYYIERQKQPEEKWQRRLSTRNIVLLKDIINKLNKLQHEDNVRQYLTAMRTVEPLAADANEDEKKERRNENLKNFNIVFSQGVPFVLLMQINRCSPFMSYHNDFTWFYHGSIQEHIDIGFGKVDETVFEKYLPNQINSIIDTKVTFFNKELYTDDCSLLDSSLKLISLNDFASANILIITLIEGVLRKFCLMLYKKQNPNIGDLGADDFAYKKNISIEKLIKNPIWKKDIPVSFAQFLTDYAHTDRPTVIEFEKKFKKHQQAETRIQKKVDKLQKLLSDHIQQTTSSDSIMEYLSKYLDEMREETNNLMREEDKTVMIGLDVYFDFLAKKLKEDRNSIIHGKYSLFKEKWKTLIYLTALQTLIDKILWHEKNV